MSTAASLRRLLLALATLGTVGTASELAMLRHWQSPIQLVPWASVAALGVGVVVLARRPGPRGMRFVRGVAVAVAITAALGVVEHVVSNYRAAPLDFRFASRWAGMSLVSRWWAAATGAVGPSPALAPAVLAQAALCLWAPPRGNPRAETSTWTGGRCQWSSPRICAVGCADARDGWCRRGPLR